MASAVRKAAVPAWRLTLQRWAYERTQIPRLGLLRDDILYENDDVKEAINRLPKNLYDERMFRITRALQLNMKKEILPKTEWTRFEDDVRYLEPYLDEVVTERKEKAEWNKQ